MKFDVIVVGGGHAGCEAAWAAARLGCDVALCTLSASNIATMPCNPAVGGTAKGQLVREIDALGGLMGRAIDATGIQFKVLNRSRGPAVWAPRAQADKARYGAWVRAVFGRSRPFTWSKGTSARSIFDGDGTTRRHAARWAPAGGPSRRRNDRDIPERPDPRRRSIGASGAGQ